MKITFLILFGFFTIKLIPIIPLLLSKGNVEVVSYNENLEYSSNNCVVSYFTVNNSNYSNGKIYCI